MPTETLHLQAIHAVVTLGVYRYFGSRAAWLGILATCAVHAFAYSALRSFARCFPTYLASALDKALQLKQAKDKNAAIVLFADSQARVR